MRFRIARGTLAALFALVAACGGGGTTPSTLPSDDETTPPATSSPTPTPSLTTPPAATAGAVDIVDNEYRPAQITVAVGARVIWTHRGGAIHSVSADDESFDSSPSCPSPPSGCMMQQATFAFTFTRAGEFAYHCKVHGPLMAGTVIVQ